MSLPKVYILTINYNNHSDTIEFIKSVKESNYPNYEIIIVDNSTVLHSMQALSNFIKQNYGSVYISSEINLDVSEMKNAEISLIQAENRGYGAANNIIIKALSSSKEISDADYILIINNDVVINRNAISLLVKKYEIELHNRVGIVAPLIYYYHTNKIWSAGGYYNKWLGFTLSYSKGKTHLAGASKKINFLTGCAWLIKIDRIKTVGPLDENFFMYGEDLDYSLKFEQKNLRLILESEAIIRHKVGSSSSGDYSSFSTYWMMFGRIRNIKKHSGGVGKYIAMSLIIFSRLIMFPWYILRNRSGLVSSQMKAIKHGLVGV